MTIRRSLRATWGFVLSSSVRAAAAAEPSPPQEPAPDTGEPSGLPPQPPAYPVAQLHPGARPPPADSTIPSVAPARGAYVHDGVFVRLSIGPGLFQTSSGRSPDDRHFDGGVVSIEGALGGCAARGFAIGAAFQTNRVFSLSSTDGVIDGDEPDTNRIGFSVQSLSLFADYYPDASDGLNFVATLGYGWLNVSRPGGADGQDPSGPIVSAGAGYEWFVASNFSLGVLARGTLGIFSVREVANTNTSVTTLIPSILVTATYN